MNILWTFCIYKYIYVYIYNIYIYIYSYMKNFLPGLYMFSERERELPKFISLF